MALIINNNNLLPLILTMAAALASDAGPGVKATQVYSPPSSGITASTFKTFFPSSQ